MRFISEVCSNHNGNLDRAKRLIETAADIGCWGVKFQLFRLEQLFAPEILSHPDYQFLQERRRWEMPLDWIPEIADYCRQAGVKFGCTPFYLEAIDELDPYVDFFKVASYEILWTDLLSKILNATSKPVIVSTGMASLEEVKQAIYNQIVQSLDAEYRISLLHCVSEYPVAPSDCHLSFIGRLRTEINANSKVGWSDHSVNPGVIYRAIHRYGAEIIEFHLDLDGDGWEYDQGHCWLPDSIKPVIQGVYDGFAADGGWHYSPSGNPEREMRADPEDGLRPLKSTRERIWKNRGGQIV